MIKSPADTQPKTRQGGKPRFYLHTHVNMQWGETTQHNPMQLNENLDEMGTILKKVSQSWHQKWVYCNFLGKYNLPKLDSRKKRTLTQTNFHRRNNKAVEVYHTRVKPMKFLLKFFRQTSRIKVL